MLNFILAPHVLMNELFHEPTKHIHLQDATHIFTLHICPWPPKEATNIVTKYTYEHPRKFPIVALYHLSIKKYYKFIHTPVVGHQQWGKQCIG